MSKSSRSDTRGGRPTVRREPTRYVEHHGRPRPAPTAVALVAPSGRAGVRWTVGRILAHDGVTSSVERVEVRPFGARHDGEPWRARWRPVRTGRSRGMGSSGRARRERRAAAARAAAVHASRREAVAVRRRLLREHLERAAPAASARQDVPTVPDRARRARWRDAHRRVVDARERLRTATAPATVARYQRALAAALADRERYATARPAPAPAVERPQHDGRTVGRVRRERCPYCGRMHGPTCHAAREDAARQ